MSTLQLPNSQPLEREPLQWRFIATFRDGTTYEQPADDRSIHHIEDAEHNPSAFSDVLERQEDLVAFGLLHNDGRQSVTVDLITGAFVVNGTPLHAHEQHFDPMSYRLRLVYFRETRLEMDAHGNPKRHYVNRYFIGWQTTVGGKNKQVTVAVG